jgi:hypothetical protein
MRIRIYNTGFILGRILNFDPPFFFNIPVPETQSTTSEVGDPTSVASSATPVSGHLNSELGAQLPTSIMTDLRPGDEVLIVLNSANTERAAAFCQIQGKDDEAVEYILDSLPTEFAARQQQQQLGTGMEGRGEAALAVGDSVVVHCAMEGTCYRGVVLELPGGQAEVPVLQMDFGTVVKVKIKKLLVTNSDLYPVRIRVRIQAKNISKNIMQSFHHFS